MIQDASWGPVTIYSGNSTAPGSWYKPRGPLSRWTYHLAGGGSTSTVTGKGRLEGTLSENTSPAAAEVFTLSTKGALGLKNSTGVQIARQVRFQMTTCTSTSSTAPTLTVKLCATL